jgi:hypothetical protein
MRLHPEIDDDQTLEVIENIDDLTGFEIGMEDIERRMDFVYLKRLNKWFKFFNQYYMESMCFYSGTILSLIDAAFNNQLFRTQTTHEFNLSLGFYKIIFKNKIFITVKSQEGACQLLIISFIFAKYPGMVLCPILKPLNKLDNDNFDLLFEELFIKHENPIVLTRNIELLSSLEIDVLMFLFQGNNIRKYPKLPLALSKKEAHVFVNELPKSLIFKNNILERTLIYIKLLSAKPSRKELLVKFLFYSNSFKRTLTSFYQDLDFWKRAFFLTCEIDEGRYDIRLRECVDYFEYIKFIEQDYNSIKGRTPSSVARSIYQWHENVNYEEYMELVKLKWEGTNYPEDIINYGNHKYLFREITNGKDLLLESEKLKHCVFSYVNECYQGFTSVWSLRKKNNSEFIHYITIEIQNKSIVQIVGKRNRSVTNSEFNLIKKWAETRCFDIRV